MKGVSHGKHSVVLFDKRRKRRRGRGGVYLQTEGGSGPDGMEHRRHRRRRRNGGSDHLAFDGRSATQGGSWQGRREYEGRRNMKEGEKKKNMKYSTTVETKEKREERRNKGT